MSLLTTRRPARFCAAIAVAIAAGCGGISRDKVDSADASRETYKVRSGRTVLVALGSVAAREELPAEVRDPVARYLRDGAKSALAQHDIFKVVTATDTATNLLGRFMASEGGTKRVLEAHADLDVEMEEVKEHMGATVKVGLVSSQKKYATAVVHVSLRLRNGGKVYEAREKGQSSQGAWGVVASVRRDAMKKSDVWKLDGSMAGTACMEALREAVADIAGQVHRDIRKLTPDAVDRLLQSRPARPAPTAL